MDSASKFEIITEAQKNGVAETCKKHKISRTLFYRWLKRYKAQGIQGLEDIQKHFVPTNKTSPDVEETVLTLIKKQPHYGPQAIKYLLEEIGYTLSESAVYNIMRRNNLSTKGKRIKYARKKDKKITASSPIFDALQSGECWLYWTTYYGHFDGIGDLYEYTIFDYISKIACSRLYTELSLWCFEDLLTAVAMPVAQNLNLEPKHLCFVEPYVANIQNISLGNTFDTTVHIFRESEITEEIKELKAVYTHQCLTFLMPHIYQGASLDRLKILLQQQVRDYNIRHKSSYKEGAFTPVDYHIHSTGTNMILPLWAYIDRIY